MVEFKEKLGKAVKKGKAIDAERVRAVAQVSELEARLVQAQQEASAAREERDQRVQEISSELQVGCGTRRSGRGKDLGCSERAGLSRMNCVLSKTTQRVVFVWGRNPLKG